MIRQPPRSTHCISSAASDVYKRQSDEEVDRWEVGAEESVLSRVIRIIRIWGSIAKWSCAGGRRTEQYPPWHPESRFASLRLQSVSYTHLTLPTICSV